jgi:CubicO group peptidase (beta-lactamase class C family)
MIRLSAVCAVLCLSLSVAAPAGAAQTDTQIDQIVQTALKTGPFPGIAVAVEQKGRVIYEKGFGYADLENKIPVTKDTVFPIGSITKTMTGLAVQQLVADGKIDLDATAGTYLPDLKAPARDVKVRNLLDHTSGLVNYIEIPEFPGSSQRDFTRDEMVSWFAERPLQFAPGTRMSYTNSGLYLLGLIIERTSGQSYDAYLRDRIFVPFGMTHSGIFDWRTLVDRRAHGYLRGRDGFRNAPRYDPLVPFAAGAVQSTVGDLLAYRHGVFGPNAKISAKVRDLVLQRDTLQDGLVLPYTLGCLVLQDFEGHRSIGHSGDIFGFSAQYTYYPDDDVTIVVLTNMQGASFPPVSIARKIAREVLGVKQPAIADLPLPADRAAQIAGDYNMGNIVFGFEQLGFVAQDGALYLRYGGTGSKAPLLKLRYQGGDRFVAASDDEETLQFRPNGSFVDLTMQFYGASFAARKNGAP